MSKNKKVNLAQVFKENEEQQQDTNAPEAVESASVNEKIAPSRRGKKNISGYFAPEVHRQLRVIAAEEDKNLQEVLGDALNALFDQKGKPTIA
ncbi:MAG: hypothetical protein OXI43_13410 [Candidatus Poribacteria bacterium]|nr:hypothetical protein [Candidatus Poribacteria bacterium]